MLRLAVFTRPGPPVTAEIVRQPPLSRYDEGWMRLDDFGVLVSAGKRPVGAARERFFPKDAPGCVHVTPEIPELPMAVKETFVADGSASGCSET
jgi:hypothetical protein